MESNSLGETVKLPVQSSNSIALNRRNFLRSVSGAAAASVLSERLLGAVRARATKAVIVTFGGGARDEETFMPQGQRNIPMLLNELLPQGTFYSQVVNKGILGHYVATASIITGVYEHFNNFAAVKPENPTIFEYYRRDLKRPISDAWVVAPSNGFGLIGESGHKDYGRGSGAGVILPKRLLSAALAATADKNPHEHLLVDNYETPFFAPALTGHDLELHQLGEVLKLSIDDFAAHARSLASPDEMSVYIAKHLMQRLAPSLLWITLHDIDIAHSGAYSLYLEGIQRSDRLCAELWRAIQNDPEYANKTALFILPDFGRDSDIDPGGNGFQHHRTGDAMARTTWMLALGPGIRQNTIVDQPIESIDLVPTLGAMFGVNARQAHGTVIPGIV